MAWGVLAACSAVLLLAPPAHNGFWALNGFRSLPADGRAGLLLVAAAAMLPVALRLQSRILWWAIAGGLALLVAFPLSEAGEFLGDTQIRLRAIAVFSARVAAASIAEWSHRLHANPLDIAVDFLLPIGVNRLGLTVVRGIQVTSFALALGYFAGLWRLSDRLGATRETRLPLALALALAGTLEAFAGYPESAGLLLVTAAWWWSEVLAPLAGRRQAVRMALAWLMLFLAHRLALVMLVPMLWRALGTAFPGDQAGARRALLGLIAVVAAVACGVLLAGVGAAQLRMDVSDMLSASRGRGGGAWLPPGDVVNALLLVAPLALLAPLLAGRAAMVGFAHEPRAHLLGLAALVLLPLAWIVPGGPNGLGAHRDWDLNVLLGITLGATAVALLARLPGPRLRGALLVALPILALLAGGWVATNSNDDAVRARARALAEPPQRMASTHLAHLYTYLGQRAMNQMRPEIAGPSYDRAFELNPNPRRALLAAEAWALSGDLAAARRDIARARSRALSPSLVDAAARLDSLVAHFAAESARAGNPDTTTRR